MCVCIRRDGKWYLDGWIEVPWKHGRFRGYCRSSCMLTLYCLVSTSVYFYTPTQPTENYQRITVVLLRTLQPTTPMHISDGTDWILVKHTNWVCTNIRIFGQNSTGCTCLTIGNDRKTGRLLPEKSCSCTHIITVIYRYPYTYI